jgi:hypothetical protein
VRKWEYKLVIVSRKARSGLFTVRDVDSGKQAEGRKPGFYADYAKGMGREGWELISVVPTHFSTLLPPSEEEGEVPVGARVQELWFKRPLQE